ncbi:putative bifunctional diguanylate cyclase/phosphodiesterase [Parathalassolituus penaei]|uniref:cyclic-guanylate-specific phosphodiesterase n=1 Tax=Parathalassolituus penaei TaxID=2997323 RepID=A0A9X3IVK2_9GAMM|nr:EAL domain-containing protein [Parathalassolituus penaei]MCY0967343.1 EAL domain-containing protein [Parathalassolituus penaei]
MRLPYRSLTQKLVLVALATTTLSLLAASLGFTWLENHLSEAELRQHLSRSGTMLANTISREQEEQGINDIPATISSLRNDEAVLRACYFNFDHHLIYSYARYKTQDSVCSSIDHPEEMTRKNPLAASFPIVVRDNIEGNLFLEMDPAYLQKRTEQFMAFTVLILFASLSLAFLLASQFKYLIIRPIRDLRATLDTLLNEKDYSIRAVRDSNDDLGELITLFNRLIETVEDEHNLLRENEARFRKLAAFSPVGIFQIDNQQQLQYVNQRWRDIHGIHIPEPTLESWFSCISSADLVEVHNAWQRLLELNESIALEMRLLQRDSSEVWVHLMAGPLHDRDGATIGYLGAISDISELKAAQLQMEHLAFYDALTGLANRRLFRNRLGKSIKAAQRTNSSLALMFLDMDQFKRVNDTLGHDAGDLLLQEVAHRLSSNVRDRDTVSRIGGDEFTILLTDVHHTSDVMTVAEKLLSALSKPIRIKGQDISTSVSIGITLTPQDSTDPNILMKNADLAMYRAKELGRNNYQFFSEDMNRAILEHLTWEKEIQDALNLNQFSVYYQPKIRLDDLTVTGVEALLRWIHPEKGMISPDKFIPVAEETGQILDIGHWVLDQSCREISQLMARGRLAPGSRVAVNLSARQFTDPNLIEVIRDILNSHSLPPECLELEITESTLMKDVEHAIRIMNDLRTLGISFAIDDFGTGYSSLSYLKRFPVEVLKVDRTFVTDIPHDDNDMAITAAVIAMAHKLGITVVAEGVETPDQLEFLRRNRCDQCQGYLFSRPLPMHQLEQFLTQFRIRDSINA